MVAHTHDHDEGHAWTRIYLIQKNHIIENAIQF